MTKHPSNGSVNAQSTVGSTVVTSGSSAYHIGPSSSERAVWKGKIALLLTLACVAAALGALSYHLLTQSENELAEAQFESIAEMATSAALEITERKRLGTVSLASVIGGANPDATEWPFVTLNNYENIAKNLIDTSKGCNMGFAPLVKPEEQQRFEDFIYEYYETSRKPGPHPNGTAVMPFGKGIWSMNEEGEAFHDNGMETAWGSELQLLAPMVHHNTGPSKKLMMNYHSNPLLGKVIDDMFQCTEQKSEMGESLDDCAVITNTLPDRTSWVQGAESGPGALMMQPVYPANEPTKFVGVIVTQIVWSEIFVSTFADCASGIDIVLHSSGQAFTYNVVQGEAFLKGEGDLHDPNYDSLAVELDVTPLNLFGPTSNHITLIVYPTQELYNIYKTNNPLVTMIGAILVIALTSIVFLSYDRLVQGEFHAKQELLEAKRKFVRFVSHEVRTPLNSVCMGLTLMKDEMAASLASNNKGNTTTTGEDSTTKNCTAWLTLTEEVAANASSAVDVLNDFLNYDKVESGKLALEHTIVPIFGLIENTASEFKLPASKKRIQMSIKTPLCNRSDDIDQGGKKKDVASCERYVVGDKVRLTQVFRNLISNAIKFTPDDGAIKIEASWTPPPVPSGKNDKKPIESSFALQSGEVISCSQHGSLVLTVTDTGAGMTDEQVKSVFRQGTQFNVNELQAGNGSGLGTYIAKGIVKQHGGVLSAASKGLNQGSTFSVTLPVYNLPLDFTTQKSGRTVTVASDDESIGSLRVLVVDDAKMNLKLLMRLLTKDGHDCEGAEDGDIAVEKVKTALQNGQHYDVILMDYQMPTMDGPTASRKIREMGCDSFIVGVTGNVMEEDVRFFKDAGANAVLPKPLKIPELVALLVEYGIRADEEDEPDEDFLEPPRYQLSFSQMEEGGAEETKHTGPSLRLSSLSTKPSSGAGSDDGKSSRSIRIDASGNFTSSMGIHS